MLFFVAKAIAVNYFFEVSHDFNQNYAEFGINYNINVYLQKGHIIIVFCFTFYWLLQMMLLV